MSLQFIHDNKGNTTGVFIPIEDWQSLKDTYTGLQNEEIDNTGELALWQKQLIDDRLNDYHQNPTLMMDFDKTIDDIEKSL
jgi:hypothetical protein